MCAVGVVEGTGTAAIAGENLCHVLGLIFRESDEANPSASKHFQLVFLLQNNYNVSNLTYAAFLARFKRPALYCS